MAQQQNRLPVIACQVDLELQARVRAAHARLKALTPGARVTFSDAMRVLIVAGLAAEHERDLGSEAAE